MTVETNMGENFSPTVTASENDSTDDSDSSFPLSDILSQPSPLSQVVHIDSKDPISFLAKVMEHNLSAEKCVNMAVGIMHNRTLPERLSAHRK